ncbi:hypothetical protein HU200_021680 [Digitaria exilis]|uniref:Uncharacterized protein n=1 Tax=Digitaria exilis TaxID=1010633 RepID=A0A835EZH2_9POAL|nr:hypothetical protein HU200_063894 [Digitaria exilis]KAF8723715.1 hypothetical protein HU200_021680 [Digitaria exilis]
MWQSSSGLGNYSFYGSCTCFIRDIPIYNFRNL